MSEHGNGVGEAKPMMTTIAVIQEIIRVLKSVKCRCHPPDNSDLTVFLLLSVVCPCSGHKSCCTASTIQPAKMYRCVFNMYCICMY